MRRFYQVQVIAMLCAAGASGQTFRDLRQYCLERAGTAAGIHWVEECLQTVFTDDPYRLTVTTVAPGAGSLAIGPAFELIPRVRHYEFLVTGMAAVSTDLSTVGEVQMTLALPGRSLDQLLRAASANKPNFGLHGAAPSPSPSPDAGTVDMRSAFTLRARRINARAQDFYGLGPNTSLSGLTSYGLQQTELYAGYNYPLTSWSSVGFDFSFLAPRVTSSVSKEVPIAELYNDQSAPGLNARDNFVPYEPYVTLKFPPLHSLNTSVRAGYSFTTALGDSRYSFRRLAATTTTTIPIWVPSHNTPSHRSWIANTACPSLRSATRCSLGTLLLTASVTSSFAGKHGNVPFYFDPTLGGADFNDLDTLRGFRDYRFRGPDDVLFQAEYRHPVWGPVGLLSFYDLGKVELRPGDLTLAGMRHDIGIGIYLHAGNRELVRFYVGFGSGEGTRATPKFPVAAY